MKLKKLAAVGSAVVMLMSVSLTPAYAANTLDTEWGFNIEPGRATFTTALREKTNASGTYVYYQGGTHSSLACDVLNSESQSMCRNIGYIAKGQKGLIAQYVYENGFRSAKLKLTAGTTTTQYGGASGVWSPDSAGSYPYINL